MGKFNFPVQKIVSFSFILRRLPTVFFPSGENARIAKKLAGKSKFKQIQERLILLLLFRNEPDSYYRLALFMPERYERAGEYLDYRQQSYLNFLLNQKIDTINTEDKILFSELCIRKNIPSPQILGLLNPLETDQSELKSHLEGAAEKSGVFFKPRFGLKAQGAGRLSYRGMDQWSIKIGDEEAINITWEQLFKKLESFNKPLIFQENLTNHPVLAEINPSALHTIRLCTFRCKGELHVLDAILRLGKKGSQTDNMSTGGLGVPILLESQTLAAGGSEKNEDLPFSLKSLGPGEISFEGLTVPFFKEAVALGFKVHNCFPEIFSLGHDIAILPNGPVVIETNHIWGDSQEIFEHGLGANRFYIECILNVG